MREQVISDMRNKLSVTMLLGRMHDDVDDLLHGILKLECIERERQEVFGTRNSWTWTKPQTSFRFRMPPAHDHSKKIDDRCERKNGTIPTIAACRPTQRPKSMWQLAIVSSQQDAPKQKQTTPRVYKNWRSCLMRPPKDTWSRFSNKPHLVCSFSETAKLRKGT